MKKLVLLSLFSFSLSLAVTAQMQVGNELLFGNEWIDYEQTYLKIKITEDGWRRLTGAQMASAGIDLSEVSGRNLTLFWMGRPIPIDRSTSGAFSPNDYIAFFGQKNQGGLDRHLFESEEDMLNPYYSMFSDTSAYFLSWKVSGRTSPDYEEVENDLADLPEKEQWYWAVERRVLGEQARYKREGPDNLLAYSAFDRGEGFVSNENDYHKIEFSSTSPVPSANTQARIRLHLVTRLSGSTMIISFNGKEFSREQVAGNNHFLKKEMDIPLSDLGASSELEIIREGWTPDGKNNRNQYAIAFAELSYPRAFDAQGAGYFAFDLAAGPRRYLEVDNFDTQGGMIWVYDLTNQKKIPTVTEGSKVRFVTEASNQDTRFVLVNEQSAFQPAEHFSTTNFVDLTTSRADFLIITHRDLFKGPNGRNLIQEYADYRSSADGGNHVTQVITVDQLYDQFAYGVYNHSLGLHNFGQYAAQEWNALKYILLLGHGYTYDINRNPERELGQNHFVPTYGVPGSDNILFAPKGRVTPSFAVGRLAVDSPEEIAVYLNKLRTYEADLRNARGIAERLWRKRVLHIGGGSEPQDQRTFRITLQNMEKFITTEGFGGFVTAVSKDNNELVQFTTSDQVKDAMSEGVAIKSFLGHGGVTGTDFGLDNPLAFNNKGKFPLIFSLGCQTGNLFDQQKSLSESFILTELGGIGYFASPGYAFAFSLEDLASEFYRLLSTKEHYTAGIGELMRLMRNKFEQGYNQWTRELAIQMSYHGDPAAKINLYATPDHIIDPGSAKIEPRGLTAAQDSFSFSFDVVNLGFNQVDTFAILLTRIFPDQEKEEVRDTISAGIGRTSLSYRFAVGEENVEGEHRIEVTLDIDNDIREEPAERGEQNNELIEGTGQKGFRFFIQQNAVLPVSPAPFAIVSEGGIKLVASSNTLSQEERSFLFQLDTTAAFNSSRLSSFQLQSRGGVLEWKPNVSWENGKVYYWRIRELDIAEIRWEERSFIYLENEPEGWNQSEHDQLISGSLDGIVKAEAEKTLEYGNGQKSIRGEAMSFDVNRLNDYSKYTEDGVRRYWGGHFEGPTDGISDKHIFVGVFDPLTGEIWRNMGAGRFGSIRRNNYTGFTFRINTPEQRKNIVDLINDSIPSGHYVLLLTSQEYGVSLLEKEWAADSLIYGTNLFETLEKQGALEIRKMLDFDQSMPYAFAFIKDVEPLDEALGYDIYREVSVEFNLPFRKTYGCITSPLIGPARDWRSVRWQPLLQTDQSDELSFSLIRWNPSRTRPDTIALPAQVKGFDISGTDARQHPYLQLRYCARDQENRSLTQLGYWRVFFSGEPDLVLTRGANYNFESDTLQQGRLLKLSAALMNFNAEVKDSIDLRISIQSTNNERTTINRRLAPMDKDSEQALSFEVDTKPLNGDQEIAVEVNPARNIIETQYANNLGVLPFFVQADNENPLLDVTFDGRRILNGELVSARPLIGISLKDENKFLEIRDTSSFQLWVDYPDGVTREFYFSDPQIQFFPAEDARKNKARVEFRPQLELDGEYTLRVSATDASGNQAGASNYAVQFKVITESQLSNILPYPNPFTTSCQFIYTLTGDREPADFKIQIMTVSGRIVREITQMEFGSMKVGTHRSDFVWDGTDEFGDPLANGVYLYRVMAKDAEGKEIKQYEQREVDGYFKNEFGKIVILR